MIRSAEDILTNEKVFREGSAVKIEGRTQLPQREDCGFSWIKKEWIKKYNVKDETLLAGGRAGMSSVYQVESSYKWNLQ